jgi:hypothetical protein
MASYPGLPQLAGQQQNIINWLQDPNQGMNDVGWEAASANVGMVGSQFGENRALVLRDRERRERAQEANDMLQPFLERENQANMQRAQLEAEAARQLVSEAGLDRRLSAENAARLELALLNGNQEAARQLVSEAGLNSRQAALLQAEMDRARMSTSAQLIQTLLQTATRTNTGSSGTGPGTGGPSYRWQTDTYGNVTGGQPPPASYYNNTGGNSNVRRVTADVDRILSQYGLAGGAGSLASYLQ